MKQNSSRHRLDTYLNNIKNQPNPESGWTAKDSMAKMQLLEYLNRFNNLPTYASRLGQTSLAVLQKEFYDQQGNGIEIPVMLDGELMCFYKALEKDPTFQRITPADQIYSKMIKRIAELEQPKAVLEQKEATLEQKEATLEQKEATLEQKKAALEQKEAELRQKEAALKQTEAALKRKEAALQPQPLSSSPHNPSFLNIPPPIVGNPSKRENLKKEDLKKEDLKKEDRRLGIFSNSPLSRIAVEKKEKAESAASEPSKTEQAKDEKEAQGRIETMNRYIDAQYQEYIARHGEKKIASKMSIVYSKDPRELAEVSSIELLPSHKLYNIFYNGSPPLADIEVYNNSRYDKNPLTIVQKGQGIQVERREYLNFEGKYCFQFDLTKNAVCILFLTEEGMTPKLEKDAESLRQHNIPFILVGVKPGTSEQDGMKAGKNLGAVLFLEWNPEGDAKNLQRLFSQVAMISKLSIEEQKRYRQDYWTELEGPDPNYWVELEYQDFIRADKNSVALIFELQNYITDYRNNPAEKVRDALVSSTLFQRVVPASKKAVYTEDIKKKAAQKLIQKLDIDITLGEQNRLDDAEQGPKFTIAEIDALVQGTLGNTVKNNLPVYNMLMLIRDKLEFVANPNEIEDVPPNPLVQPYSEQKTTEQVSPLGPVAADSSEKEKDDNGLRIKFLQEGWPPGKAFHAEDPQFMQAFKEWQTQRQQGVAQSQQIQSAPSSEGGGVFGRFSRK